MIQRIQTVYLLLVTILTSITLFSDSLFFGETYSIGFKGLRAHLNGEINLLDTNYALVAIMAIIPIISLVSIFLFKNRMLQIRLSVFNIVMMVGYYALLGYYFYFFNKQYCGGVSGFPVPTVASAFPLVSAILTYLSIRRILADELLVKSLNRIR